MPIPVKELRFWLNTLEPDAIVGIDHDTLQLVDNSTDPIKLDVGGKPEPEPAMTPRPSGDVAWVDGRWRAFCGSCGQYHRDPYEEEA